MPPVTEGGLALQEGREGGAQDPQLIDEMTDLQALIVIFRRLPVDARRLVLQGIAEVFLGVKPLVFDLPAQAPGVAEHGDRGGGDGEVGQVNKATVGWRGAVAVTDCFDTFKPVEPVAVIVDVGDPAKVLYDPLLALEALLAAVRVRAAWPQRLHFLPDAGQIAVLAGQDKDPVVGAAGIEKALIGVEPIGGQPDWQSWVALLELSGQAHERLALAVLFFIVVHRLGDPLRGQRDRQAVGGDQLCLQHRMEVRRLARARGLMKTLLAMALGKAHRPGGVDRHHKIRPQEAVAVQRFLLQQRFHQLLLELFQRFIGQPTQHPVHRVQVRQPQLEQAAVVLRELRFLTQVVERIPRALLENEQRDGRHQDLAQRIV